MEIFIDFFEAITAGMNMDFTVYDFTFSFMDLFLFNLFASILVGFLGFLLNNFFS